MENQSNLVDLNSTFWESVWYFSQEKNAAQPNPANMSQLTNPCFFFAGKPYNIAAIFVLQKKAVLPNKKKILRPGGTLSGL